MIGLALVVVLLGGLYGWYVWDDLTYRPAEGRKDDGRISIRMGITLAFLGIAAARLLLGSGLLR